MIILTIYFIPLRKWGRWGDGHKTQNQKIY